MVHLNPKPIDINKTMGQFNILFIGYGKMGACLGGLITNGHSALGLKVKTYKFTSSINELADANLKTVKFNLVCIFTKPQNTLAAFASLAKATKSNIASCFNKDTVFISILAGKDYDFIKQSLLAINYNPQDSFKYARLMPNLGLLGGRGFISAFFKDLPQQAKDNLLACFKNHGRVFEVDAEEKIDPLTAVFGCGSGFAAFVANAFNTAAEHFLQSQDIKGLDKSDFTNIFTSVFSLALQDKSFNLETFANNVASKGGATEAGYNAMLNCGGCDDIEDVFAKTFGAALNRAKELKVN